MKIIFFCLLLGTTLGAPGKDLTIKEFEEKFHQKFADPKDEADANSVNYMKDHYLSCTNLSKFKI